VLAGDLLLLPGSRGTLFALDANSGSEHTAVSLGSASLTKPLVHENAIIVADSQGTVNVLNPESFVLQQQVVFGGSVSGFGVLVDSTAVYAVTGNMLVAV